MQRDVIMSTRWWGAMGSLVILAAVMLSPAHAGDVVSRPFAQLAQAQDAAAPGSAPADDVVNDAAGADADAVADADTRPLRRVLRDMKGLVRRRMSVDDPWQTPTVGMQIPQGAEFRTGPRSAVLIQVGGTQTITLDRLGTIKVLRAIQEAETETIKTDVGMPYGRTRYTIQAGGRTHESNIRAPSATLAVRGSDVVFQDDAFGAVARGEGRLAMVIRDVQRTARSFGEGQTSKIAASRAGAADTAKGDATTDPRGGFVARTPLEEQMTEAMPEVGGDDLRELQDLIQKRLAFSAGVSIPANLQATMIFIGVPDFTQVELSIISPPGFAVSFDNPVSSNGRATFLANPSTGLAGPDGSGANSLGIDLTGLGRTTFTFSLDLRSADAAPVVVPVFNLVESPFGQAAIILNDMADPPIPPSGVVLTPAQPNFTTSVTAPSP